MAVTWADLEANAMANENALPESEFKKKIERAVTANSNSSAPSVIDQKLSRGAKRFPWILKNWKRKQVMYDGDLGFINETLDPYYASRWYEQNKENKRDVKEQFF